ncbi:MAG: redox-regulated ATPase YchF [Planctomycetota bacterium]|jgi:GTP-binding protein YchF
MECGIVGLPGCGKTTLFNALTGSAVSGFSDAPHLGQARIPDPRLDLIASYIDTKKVVPATLQLVDIHGVAPGGGAEKLNSFLVHCRQVDAVCHVVRCFDDGRPVNPVKDIEAMDTELVLADLVVAEGCRDKAERPARAGDADAKTRLAVLEKIVPVLEDGRAVRTLDDLTDGDHQVLRSYGMITAKPVLFVANVGEDDLAGEGPGPQAVREAADAVGSRMVSVCAKLEAELAELEEPDRGEMLTSLGLAEAAIGPLARAANAVLGLSTFYTAGPKQVRAWIIPVGATAPEAAGAIHSDMQRGFIRAECYHVDELDQYKTEKAIREAGHLRSEGKHYALQDGDVVHFLFNV